MFYFHSGSREIMWNFMPSLIGETKFPQQNVNPLKAGNSDYSRVFPQHITQYLQENQHWMFVQWKKWMNLSTEKKQNKF